MTTKQKQTKIQRKIETAIVQAPSTSLYFKEVMRIQVLRYNQCAKEFSDD